LRDLIASKVCGYGELTEIKRNSGGIAEACAAIRDGKRWEEGDNLTLIDATSETATAKALHLLEQVHLNGLDSVWDAQVIVAVNEKSELSRAKINRILQHELNHHPEIKGTPFRLADKIVCTKNGKYPLADKSGDDAEVYVANGELAQVIAVEEKRLLARLRITGEEIVIPRGKPAKDEGGDDAATGCNWDLAYGLSCHKMQGSECPVAIVMLDEYPGARRVCSREWLYTSISRAKVHCYLVGKRHIADAMCRTQAINKRKTLLRERIQLAMATKSMEGMF
jgi:exodeoxyribonuclease V alpha subunit